MTFVLVTGGAGYIGSHACKALARAGYVPVVYDDLRRGHDWAVRWGPLEQGDVLDRVRLDAVIAQYQPSAVMHFAGYAYVNESVSDPGMYYRNNTVASLNLLEALRDSSVRRIIFSSTCATYGDPETLPIKEDAPQRPINPYGASKLMTERMIADFASAHGLGWVALRYFNAAGADPDGEIGEAHDPEPHLIPLVLDAAAGTRPYISVYGVDYPTPDGTCVRDYIHVSDLADAHVLALRSLEGGGRSGAYNLGNNSGYSIREVISSVERVTGLRVPVVEGPRRAGDPAALVGDGGRAIDALGWAPRFPALDDIVRTAWAWRQKGGAR
jgi:UDP-arabinose 4-epimerase